MMKYSETALLIVILFCFGDISTMYSSSMFFGALKHAQ